MGKNHDIIEIDVEVLHSTDKAWMLNDADNEEVWLPKSMCEYDDTDKTMQLPEWLAFEKGLI